MDNIPIPSTRNIPWSLRQSTTPVAVGDQQVDRPTVSAYAYVSVLLVALFFSMCFCGMLYRLCSTDYWRLRSRRRRQSANRLRPTVADVFTVSEGVNVVRRVSLSSGRPSNINSLFDYLPPSYDEVIVDSSNNSAMIFDDDGLPRYETFTIATQKTRKDSCIINESTSSNNLKTVEYVGHVINSDVI